MLILILRLHSIDKGSCTLLCRPIRFPARMGKLWTVPGGLNCRKEVAVCELSQLPFAEFRCGSDL